MLQSLERTAGLPIALDPQACRIRFTGDVAAERETSRSFEEMKEFIADPSASSALPDIYFMYRNVSRRADQPAIAAAHLRYDITVIPPGAFSGGRREFYRTAGHYHALRPDGKTAYPEIYEVLSGRAHWLLQRPAPGQPEIIEECHVIVAGPGEKVVLLPGYGHISVNAGTEPLVLANWINDTFAYDYEPYRRLRGSGWLMFDGGADGVIFEKNPRYGSVAELKKFRPKEVPEFCLSRSEPSYTLARQLEKIRFLSAPEEYAEILSPERVLQSVRA